MYALSQISRLAFQMQACKLNVLIQIPTNAWLKHAVLSPVKFLLLTGILQ